MGRIQCFLGCFRGHSDVAAAFGDGCSKSTSSVGNESLAPNLCRFRMERLRLLNKPSARKDVRKRTDT